MMDVSRLKDDEMNPELSLLRLEFELNRVKQTYQFNESLWMEKEDSLNSIISEQKKAISLLESLLKNSQQWLDTAQLSLAHNNNQIELLNESITKSFDATNEQVKILKATAEQAEHLLGERESELIVCRQHIDQLMRQVEDLSLKLANEALKNENGSKTADELQKRLKNVTQEVIELGKKNNELKGRYQSLWDSHASLKLGHENALAKISRLEKENGNHLDSAKGLIAGNSAFKEKIEKEKNQLILKFQSQIDRLLSYKLEKENEVRGLQSRVQELNQLIAQEKLHARELLREKNALAEDARKLNTKMEGLLAREIRYKNSLSELENKVVAVQDKVRATISYQLGQAILQAGKSFHGFSQLPQALMRIRRDAKRRKLVKQGRMVESVSQQLPLKSHYSRAEKTVLTLDTALEINKDKKLKIAGVMDEFTYHSYAPESDILQLHPENWEQQLNEFKPDLLFIESAWQGLDGLWKTKISNAKEEILGAIKWSNSNNIPTMFWNKEDPVHFGTFLPIASLVDFVFTTDIDCIPKYKKRVGHDNVFLLPFAAQPKTHNPIEKFDRKDAFNFAGSYYLRYPERQRDFASLMDTVQQFKDVEIYDRNFDNPHPHYTFPEKYRRFILGKLPFSEIDKAYKGYRYGINMNTIKQSQTMFARRVFELLASNTIVVSNFSRGVRLLFGDLVVSSDDVSQLKNHIEVICRDELSYRKYRLAGLRKVFSEHTYSHRLAYIRAKLSQQEYKVHRSNIYVVAKVSTQASYDMLRANFERQEFNQKFLLVVSDGVELSTLQTSSNVEFFSSNSEFYSKINSLASDEYVAVFADGDYYGKNYLNDLELATLYSEHQTIGKYAFYEALDAGSCKLVGDGTQYSVVAQLAARRAIIKRAALTGGVVEELYRAPETVTYNLTAMLAVDEFNYCAGVGNKRLDEVASLVGDLNLVDSGVSYTNQLVSVSESLPAMEDNEISSSALDPGPGLSGEELFSLTPKPASSTIQFAKQGSVFKIVSKLPAGKHVYAYTSKSFARDELNLVLNSQFKLECKGSLEAMTVFEFQDKEGVKISHSMNKVGDSHALAIPEHCVYVRFGLKLQASGQLLIDRLSLGTKNEKPFAVIGKGDTLVLSKQYPDYDDLYKYGFVHSRVRTYRKSGLLADIFRINHNVKNYYREFEGVDIASGDYPLLNSTLNTGQFKTLLVHILDEKTWDAIRGYLPSTRIIVWIHGSEIQHWKRRAFEFKNMSDAEVTRQKKLSDRRMKFWKGVFSHPHENLHFVFVSKWLLESTEEDLGIKVPQGSFSIINNFIDGNIFKYSQKEASDRLNLLSIRPYAKLVYANDLTVAAIVELSKRSFFSKLRFTLVGDGELFEETVQPVREFSNVTIKKQFLTHNEIAQYHKQNGIFLVPSRMDTQGVSRDEAMLSGLVPITTNVAAIPEFVDERVGLIVDAEDYKAIADAVEFLYNNEDKYLKLSRNASNDVAHQRGFDNTLKREMDLIAN